MDWGLILKTHVNFFLNLKDFINILTLKSLGLEVDVGRVKS